MTLSPRSIAKVVTAVTIALIAIGTAPRVAEAQSTGIMQASATVVATDDSFRALQAAREAVFSRPITVATVARVSVARNPESVVVTINYSRS